MENIRPEEGIVVVSYMIKADKGGRFWEFPEKTDVNDTIDTSSDQIIATKVQVHYSGSVRIKCKIESLDLIDEMNTIIKSHKST